MRSGPTLRALPQDGGGRPILDGLPFDHERQLASVLVDTPTGRLLIAKGAPEGILARCTTVPATSQATLDSLFSSGVRVVAVASRAVTLERLSREDERDLSLDGFLCFSDPAKPDVQQSLARLDRLGITVKIVTGDNGQVAAHLCHEVGLDPKTVLTGTELATMDDAALLARLPETTVFARVTPEQKSRIILAERSLGVDVGFLGDGVNDAIALHDADVGISVDSAADVAKDAADVVLLDKDLGIIADGVVEGRRIFANTIKYVLMGTSSNFGNMFSAAGASLFLSFLPMLPTQILLNNLLYDVSEMTIPTDNVDEELLERPSQWDIRLIRRFMSFFGPISSVYDFITFAVMLRVFHAGPVLFRSGWFVESLVTQTLVIFVIRTRRVPFFKSHPSRPLLCRHARLCRTRRRDPIHRTTCTPVRLPRPTALVSRRPRRDDRDLSRSRPGRRRALLQATRRSRARPGDRPPRTPHHAHGLTLELVEGPHATIVGERCRPRLRSCFCGAGQKPRSNDAELSRASGDGSPSDRRRSRRR